MLMIPIWVVIIIIMIAIQISIITLVRVFSILVDMTADIFGLYLIF